MNVKRGRLIYVRSENFEASVGSKGVERENSRQTRVCWTSNLIGS